MCGFVGYWQFNSSSTQETLQNTVAEMAALIDHRGPDSSGVWCDSASGIAMGHRRLAIIDLSNAGQQPMVSQSGEWVIIYNGEIYNTNELRDDLAKKGVYCRGHSDTEVLLEACQAWGVKSAVSRCNGMFAFALWNRAQKKLYCVRDRVGIKPLYWGWQNNTLLFGSQIKAFTSHPQWQPEIDRDALTGYFRFNYMPAQQTIYRNIHCLQPGHLLVIDAKGDVQQECYWDLSSIIAKSKVMRKAKPEDLVAELDHLLRDAVKRRMVSDVPLGAFLSGGIDSSTVVALMQAQSSKPVKTFSIGFYESDYNEAEHAKIVAKHLQTEHHECYLHAKEAIDLIPKIPDWYDEPFADSSQIPTFLVSRLAREHVTVSLSGDGGDELFAGYNRYFLAQKLWSRFEKAPGYVRDFLAKAICWLSPEQWDKLGRLLPPQFRIRHVGDKAYKFSKILQTTSDDLYRSLVSLWDKPEELVIHGNENYRWPSLANNKSYVEWMQFIDTMTYLPGDILTKVDRASMGVSLEARVPLLDHRVLEFAWRVPLKYKINNKSKWLLRQVLYRYVPPKLVDRPKMGFGVPIDQWLRGPLRDWAEDLLCEHKLKADGILNSKLVRERWQEHLSGKRNWHYSLWGVLMFQAWKNRWGV